MLATGLRAIQVTLLAACAYLLYLSLSPLVGAAPIPETRVPELPPATSPARDFPRYQIIADRNLFQTPEGATAAPTEAELEESKLRLRLRGTTAAVPASLSVATVEDVAKRETLSLRVDDWVSGAQVVRIERGRIVVDNRGTLEQLTLEEAEKTTPKTRAPRTTRESRAASVRSRTANARTTRARRAPRRQPTPKPAAAPQPRVNTQDFFGPDALDLEEGESVSAVNGIDVNDRARLQEIFEALSEAGPKTITVETPDGGTREITMESQ